MREPYKKRNGRRVITSLLCLSVLTTPIVSEAATEQTNNSKITSKEQIGHMILQVTPSNPTPMPGETITYRYKLTNATNKVIKDVWIADWNVNMLQGRFDLDNDNAFGPGETITMTKKFTVPNDVTEGQTLRSLATVYGVIDGEKITTQAKTLITVDVVQPEISLTVSTNKEVVTPGETIIYTYHIKNTGNRNLTNVWGADWHLGMYQEYADIGPDKILIPGEEVTVQKEFTVPEDAEDQKLIYSVASYYGYYGDTVVKQDARIGITVSYELINKATKGVNRLFTDEGHSTLHANITQRDIDASAKLVLSLPEAKHKQQLQQELEKAQNLLNHLNNATSIVHGLFGDESHSILHNETSKTEIDAAKEKVSQLPDNSNKTELLNEIKKAQQLLKEREATQLKNAQQAVNALFSDDKHAILNDSLTEKEIKEAKQKVELVSNLPEKEVLQKEIERAEHLLNVLNETRKNVDSLFTDRFHTALKETITQVDIDNVKIKVDQLSDNNDKQTLIKEIEKAQNLFNATQTLKLQNAQKAINDLFTANDHNTLKANITQADIDASKAKVDQLPDTEDKTNLLDEIKKAQRLFSELQKAQELLESLFTNGIGTPVKQGITQTDIDKVRTDLKKLPDSPGRTKLLSRVPSNFSNITWYAKPFGDKNVTDSQNITVTKLYKNTQHAPFIDFNFDYSLKGAQVTVSNRDVLDPIIYPDYAEAGNLNMKIMNRGTTKVTISSADGLYFKEITVKVI
ncbi:toxin Cry1Ac domain D-VI-related protein [Bacillus cytotoxicus]|uniref:toxin Cry1Ac domain D-VI-related protein n=1 Tax=Bacillus cytotoxicus TaxID=580165 RepID=UPI0035CBEC7C